MLSLYFYYLIRMTTKFFYLSVLWGFSSNNRKYETRKVEAILMFDGTCWMRCSVCCCFWVEKKKICITKIKEKRDKRMFKGLHTPTRIFAAEKSPVFSYMAAYENAHTNANSAPICSEFLFFFLHRNFFR